MDCILGRKSLIATGAGILLLLNSASLAQFSKSEVRLLFMEPDTLAASAELPAYTVVTDQSREKAYRGWTANEPAQWAIHLYDLASRVRDAARPGTGNIPTYYIALVPQGNEAAVGFRLRDSSGIKSYPAVPYIKLAPDDWAFTTTFLHETGHVVLRILNGGKDIPSRSLAPIPHSTAMLTDRGTAFDEGFAISLETLAARFTNDPVVRESYHHDRYRFGIPRMQSEYHRQVIDLLTFSQTRSRYQDVAENCFAFRPAFKGPDYLRVQLEKSRDFSAVRSADQLLQSEGFYASFFYSFLLRGSATPDTVSMRQERVLKALDLQFRSSSLSPESPFLLDFALSYMKLYPEEAPDVVDVLLELSHGVFVDPQASILWRDHYLGALRLDMAERKNPAIMDALKRWHNDVLKDPRLLYSRLGPQIGCEVPEDSVQLLAFGDPSPLTFDLNTVEEGVIRMVPQITEPEVRTFLARRDERPYQDAGDFKRRSGLSEASLKHFKF